MATTLPGSPYVESSDLVANYPAVSEALAERVDLVGVLPFSDAAARTTALPTPTDGQYSYLQDTNSTEYYNGAAWVEAGAVPGLVHVNTTAFSAVASVSFNDVFTATYDNYYIIGNISNSAANYTEVRLRNAGADITSATYNTQGLQVSGTTVQGFRSVSQTKVNDWLYCGAGENSIFTMEVLQPAVAIATYFKSDGLRSQTGPVSQRRTTYEATAAARDGISFIPLTGSITGTIRVYGFKNS